MAVRLSNRNRIGGDGSGAFFTFGFAGAARIAASASSAVVKAPSDPLQLLARQRPSAARWMKPARSSFRSATQRGRSRKERVRSSIGVPNIQREGDPPLRQTGLTAVVAESSSCIGAGLVIRPRWL
jgi:hypothetical protein